MVQNTTLSPASGLPESIRSLPKLHAETRQHLRVAQPGCRPSLVVPVCYCWGTSDERLLNTKLCVAHCSLSRLYNRRSVLDTDRGLAMSPSDRFLSIHGPSLLCLSQTTQVLNQEDSSYRLLTIHGHSVLVSEGTRANCLVTLLCVQISEQLSQRPSVPNAS